MTILYDKDNTQESYAELYSKYQIKGTPSIPFRDLPKILDKYVRGKKALDYGSGTGESTIFLKSLGYDTNGVDISESMIIKSKENDKFGEYTKIENNIIPFQDDGYDLVFCSFVLLEISTREKILDVLKEIHRVLKKDGIFVAVVANENTYKHDWLSLNTDFKENKNITSGQKVKIEFRDFDLTIFDYFWSKDDYKDLISKANLSLVKIFDPLGLSTDGYKWRDEQYFAPSSIIVARKE